MIARRLLLTNHRAATTTTVASILPSHPTTLHSPSPTPTPTTTTSTRSYISRAHRHLNNTNNTQQQQPIAAALEQVLVGVTERTTHRAKRWERNTEKRAKGGKIKDDGPYRNQDETIELVLNLNLDPRKPGQSLRGSLPLPHGTGKKSTVCVFTTDDESATAAKEAGATLVGGNELVQGILDGSVGVSFDRCRASPEMMPGLSKISRILGPRGLMPNGKLGTIQPAGPELVLAVQTQVDGVVQYRAEKNGIVQIPVGKASMGEEKLVENMRAFLGEIQEKRPDSYGKGKKTGGADKSTPFYLKAFLGSQQGKSVGLDVKTVDPTSNYYMETVPK